MDQVPVTIFTLARNKEGLRPVQVDVKLYRGLPRFDLLGLCDASVRESRGRIRAALESAGFILPRQHIVVSLSPASLRKRGSEYDLPIAVGILMASGQVPRIDALFALGELDLQSRVRMDWDARYWDFWREMARREIKVLLPNWIRADSLGEASSALCVGPFETDLNGHPKSFEEMQTARPAFTENQGRGGIYTLSSLKTLKLLLEQLLKMESVEVVAETKLKEEPPLQAERASSEDTGQAIEPLAEECAALRVLQNPGSMNLHDRHLGLQDWSYHPALARHFPEQASMMQDRAPILEEIRKQIRSLEHVDLRMIYGQSQAIRALALCLLGAHPSIFLGAPGCGKSMLARSAKLLQLQVKEIEVIRANAKTERRDLERWPTFCEVSHTVTPAQLIGGTRTEQSYLERARGGILYLDEIFHFAPGQLDLLKPAFDLGAFSIKEQMDTSREEILAYSQFLDSIYGAPWTESKKQALGEKDLGKLEQDSAKDRHFFFLATGNPCPCGHRFDRLRPCTCKDHEVERYLKKLKEPFCERIHLWHEMPTQEVTQLSMTVGYQNVEAEKIPEQIYLARLMAQERQKRLGLSQCWNAFLTPQDLGREGVLSETLLKEAESFAERFHLSVRGYHNLLKLTRSIADLEQKEEADLDDLYEAVSYRKEEHV